jgi:hypothetical protein
MGILTAASHQAVIQKISPSKSVVVLSYKVKIINMLNSMLNDREKATSDEAMTAVISLIIREWYERNSEGALQHMRGLNEMMRLRGGLHIWGMHTYVRLSILM